MSKDVNKIIGIKENRDFYLLGLFFFLKLEFFIIFELFKNFL